MLCMIRLFFIVAICAACNMPHMFGQYAHGRIITEEQWAIARKNSGADSSVQKSLAKRMEFLHDTLVLLEPPRIIFTSIDSILWHRVDSIFMGLLQLVQSIQDEGGRRNYFEVLKTHQIIRIMTYKIDKKLPTLQDNRWIEFDPVIGRPVSCGFWGSPPIDEETGQIIYPPTP